MTAINSDDSQFLVLLGFDIDGVSSAINRDPDSANLPSLMSMREYGPSVATPRILNMLDRYDIHASFYVPGYVAETHPDLVKDIHARGHEIAHHGYMHEPPATLTRDQEAEVLDKGIEILGGLTGQPPLGYRSPSWELSEHSLELLADRDFLYDSSLMGDDVPYIVNVDDRSLVEIPVHWELDDAPYFNYAPLPRRPLPHGESVPRLRRLVFRLRGRLPLRTRLHPHHAPLRHRQARPPPYARTPHPLHPRIPRRPLRPRR